MPAADTAQHQPSWRQRERGKGVAAFGLGKFGPQALVEVPGVAHFGRHIGGKVIFTHRIIDGGIPIHPDHIVVLTDGVLVGRPAPLVVRDCRVIQHIAQTEHAAGMPARAQIGQGRIELPDRTPRDVVHD